jgi:outer membrane protein OmpA-like peptidoglycan-associated protein
MTVAIMIMAMVTLTPDLGTAQLGKLKDKVKKEAEKKLSQPKEAEKAAPVAEESPGDDADSAVTPPAGGGDEFQLYTKFDFVPGQQVLYFDDLSGEELGEFPSRWRLKQGVFEIAKVGADAWIMATTRGQINPRLNVNRLPERYTVEFEYLNRTAAYRGTHYVNFLWLDSTDAVAAYLQLFNNNSAHFYMRNDQGSLVAVSDKQLPPSYGTGVQNVRVMVTKSTVKCYVGNERLVNAPKSSQFLPAGFAIAVHADDVDFEIEKMFFRNFRFAEGGKTMREQLDESGQIVTHGIYFDVNSDNILGESYKTLADIAQMLTDDGTLALKIGGHTDSDGSDASNLELSQRRAEAVRQYLVTRYQISDDRLQAEGHGESTPIDANTTPEGKANNRRVEFVKI